MNDITILAHQSIPIKDTEIERQNETDRVDNKGENALDPSAQCQSRLVLSCERDGVFWRGVWPLLVEAPIDIAFVATELILDKFPPVSGNHDFWTRIRQNCVTRRVMSRKISITDNEERQKIEILLVPPQDTYIQRSFSACLIRFEHLYTILRSLSAWLSTLGGGYFFCSDLASALQIAKQQRNLALMMGDNQTADRCTINIAFNYIHSGLFSMARTKILEVRASAIKRKDKSTISAARAAYVFMRRVKEVLRSGKKGNKFSCENFQRIQIITSHPKLQ